MFKRKHHPKKGWDSTAVHWHYRNRMYPLAFSTCRCADSISMEAHRYQDLTFLGLIALYPLDCEEVKVLEAYSKVHHGKISELWDFNGFEIIEKVEI